MENNTHIPVLLESTLEALDIKKGGKYIDCTLGAGGHTKAMLEAGAEVLAIDLDEKMLKFAEERLNPYCPTLVRGNFKNIEEIATKHSFAPVDGILFDLGVSNLHYTSLERGFSFKKPDEPLDMRLSTVDSSVTAAQLLNVLSESQLIQLFGTILATNKARKFAKYIVQARADKQFETVADLASIARQEAAEIFLALRIAVNSEFDSLTEGLVGAFNVLKNGGNIVVISFHSLEDKIVVNRFRNWQREGKGIFVTKDPVIPSSEEIEANAKSRSAIMRIFKKNEQEI